MARDTRALTDEVEHFDEPSMEMKRAAQRVVCGFSTDADDATELLMMLGIHPDQLKEPPGLVEVPGRTI